jgi:hypothetical protein
LTVPQFVDSDIDRRLIDAAFDTAAKRLDDLAVAKVRSKEAAQLR